MTIWTTKHALTEGIRRYDNAEDISRESRCADVRRARVVLPDGRRLIFHSKEWHTSEAAAIERAKDMRTRELAALRKATKRLEGLRFEPAGHGQGPRP